MGEAAGAPCPGPTPGILTLDRYATFHYTCIKAHHALRRRPIPNRRILSHRSIGYTHLIMRKGEEPMNRQAAGFTFGKTLLLTGALLVIALVTTMCAPAATPTEETAPEEAPVAEPSRSEATLAIMHFSIIEGTTWSGAHHRAGERIDEKYPAVDYVFREEVGPDQAVPFAEELIADGADIVIGNAEFMGLPLMDIADKYPDVYFGTVVTADLNYTSNFVRFFPRQYQALYLEGLIAGALTETGNVGIVSSFPTLQVHRRQAGFILGVQDAAELLDKEVNIYIKYVGDWYLPEEEREIAETLVSQFNVDVLTQQTDSGSPLDVAVEEGIWFVGKDMDIVGHYGWGGPETVAVSFDTRWEVVYDRIIKDWMVGNRTPGPIYFLGMNDYITLADGTKVFTVDIMNDGKVGVEAVSDPARPNIPDEILALVEQRRDQMIKGVWDPFFAHELVSNGTGVELEGLPVPPEGEVVKPANVMPDDEWLLGQFNFDLAGVNILD